MRFSGKIFAILFVFSVALAGSASGLSLSRPVLGVMEGQFDYINAWEGFGIAVEAYTQEPAGFYVLSLRDTASGATLRALWDGSSLLFDEKGNSWAIPVSIGSGSSAQKAKLISSWTDKAPFDWGIATLGMEGQLTDSKAAYMAGISLIGSSVSVPKDGSYAVIRSAERDSDGLFAYLIARSRVQTASFKPSSLKKVGITAGTAIFEVVLTGAQPQDGSKDIELTLVRAISDEDAIALGEAWVASYAKAASKRPDVRLTGTIDKPRVNPGDKVRYTYYLFNAGMDQAKGLSVAIPVPQGGRLLSGSISGDSGKALLKPSGATIDLAAGTDVDTLAYEGAIEISWVPSEGLKPGAVMKFSFDFLVK